MSDWDEILARLDSGTGGVLVTIAEVAGSAPREAGTRMIVTGDVCLGSIGGGHLEFKAIAAARDLIGTGRSEIQEFPLGPSLGQCCGGKVALLFEDLPAQGADGWRAAVEAARHLTEPGVLVSGDHSRKMLVTEGSIAGSLGAGSVETTAIATARELLRNDGRVPSLDRTDDGAILLFEPLRPNDFSIVIFGAGHVGRALVKVLAEVSCQIIWVDSREDEFPDALPPNVRAEVSAAPEYDVDAAPPDSFFLVTTHSHQVDLKLSERILRRGDFRYFGLIGSATKRRRFEKRLLNRGLTRQAIDRMTCPIGVQGITGKHPAVIAVAVAAEVLALSESLARNDERGDSLSA